MAEESELVLSQTYSDTQVDVMFATLRWQTVTAFLDYLQSNCLAHSVLQIAIYIWNTLLFFHVICTL